MSTNRSNTICLLEIFLEYSDIEHILTMREIQSKMQCIYGLKPDRRTIYSAVSLLIDLGYDISTYEDNGRGYFLRSRQFEQSEIILLTDAVHSFPFIPIKQSIDLISKLQMQLSVYQRKKFRHLSFFSKEDRHYNQQVFWNIELLDLAITKKHKVGFTYLQYGMDKKLHSRRETRYIVSPYNMIYTNEHYYLLCRYDEYADVKIYRIDLIQNLQMLDDPIVCPNINNEEFAQAVYAFVSKPEQITIRCEKIVLGDVLDKFGTSIKIKELCGNFFLAEFAAPPKGVKFWALQYLPYVEVLQPEWLRSEIVESIKKSKYHIEEEVEV